MAARARRLGEVDQVAGVANDAVFGREGVRVVSRDPARLPRISDGAQQARVGASRGTASHQVPLSFRLSRCSKPAATVSP